MTKQKSLAFLILFLCAVACAENPSSPELDRLGANAHDLAKLLADIESIRSDANVTAVGIALVSRDKVIHVGGLGVQRLGSVQAATSETWFRLGSITKSFVGLTALSRLRERPELFSVPVNAVLPNVLSADAEHGGDTVRLPELLEHTAGLGDLSRKEFAFQGETVTFKEAIGLDPDTRVLRWPASQHSSYSNAGYGLAGYMLEVDANDAFETLVEKYVLSPTGMETAGFFVTEDTPVLAAGYDTDGVTPIPYWHMLYRSFGGLNATPKDMAKFLQALLQPAGPDSLFRNAAERLRFENPATTLAADTGLTYGYGLGNYHWFSQGLLFHGHGGDADGYLSHYGYSNEAGFGYFIVVTAYNKKPLNEMRDELERYIARQAATEREGGASRARTDDVVELPESVLRDYAGDYVEVTKRFGRPNASANIPSLTVTIKNNQLHTRFGKRRRPLVAVSEHHFKRPWQPGATYAFITAADGDVYLQGDMGNFKRLGPGPELKSGR
ncbi:MAG: serine hydrolase domain-containing protein [Gammaproteobacteria bacterium]